jgi:hypothetical protein
MNSVYAFSILLPLNAAGSMALADDSLECDSPNPTNSQKAPEEIRYHASLLEEVWQYQWRIDWEHQAPDPFYEHEMIASYKLAQRELSHLTPAQLDNARRHRIEELQRDLACSDPTRPHYSQDGFLELFHSSFFKSSLTFYNHVLGALRDVWNDRRDAFLAQTPKDSPLYAKYEKLSEQAEELERKNENAPSVVSNQNVAELKHRTFLRNIFIGTSAVGYAGACTFKNPVKSFPTELVSAAAAFGIFYYWRAFLAHKDGEGFRNRAKAMQEGLFYKKYNGATRGWDQLFQEAANKL